MGTGRSQTVDTGRSFLEIGDRKRYDLLGKGSIHTCECPLFWCQTTLQKKAKTPKQVCEFQVFKCYLWKQIFSSYLLNCRISTMILDRNHGWTPQQLSPPPTNVGLEGVLFTFPNKKTRIFQVPALSFFRGLIRNSWLDSQLKTTSLEIPFDRVSLLNKNLEHRHQQNVALMRLGYTWKKSILTKCSSNTMEINKPQGYLHNLNNIWKLFVASNPILAAEIVDGKSSYTHDRPFETFLFLGGEVFSHTLSCAVKSLWAHGHQFPLHYIQRLKGPEFRNISKTSGFFRGVISSM